MKTQEVKLTKRLAQTYYTGKIDDTAETNKSNHQGVGEEQKEEA